MAEQQLNGADVGAGFQEMDREGVPQRMGRNRLGNPGSPMGLPAGAVHRPGGDRSPGAITRKSQGVERLTLAG